MVYLAPLIGAAALLSNFALAAPRPMPSQKSSQSSESSSNYNGGNGDSSYNSNDNSNYNNNDNSNYNNNGNSYNGNSYNGNSGNNYNGNSGSYSGSNYNGNSGSYNGNYNTPSYGSGSSNYNNYGSGYDDCVSQCIAQYGNSAYQYDPTPTSSNSDNGSNYNGSNDSNGSNYQGGSSSDSSEGSQSSQSSSQSSSGDSGSVGTNAVTHTVIVAPSQGVFRYVPFALNASVGDTIEFRWGADGHTVTHSDALAPCNKSADNPFASGLQNKGFVYHQAVNTTNQTFFYCGAPSHCQKGMFGIINPDTSLDAPTSVSGMMQSLIAQDDDLRTFANATQARTGQEGPASEWGGSINIGNLAPEYQALAVSNVFYTRNVLAMNADNIWKNGSIDLSGVAANPSSLMFPLDLGRALSQADATAPPPNNTASTPAVAGATNASATDAPATTQTQGHSGAESLASSKLFIAIIAVISTFLVL